ncbi:MAG: hypothetical protein J7K59_04480 [Candidatus Korarchaeota archaeon]|nr:hypothetical protein [Candidatus Korarchaeota archaeon]
MDDEELALALTCENCPEEECPYKNYNDCPTLKLVKSDKRLQRIILNIFSLPYGTNTKEV